MSDGGPTMMDPPEIRRFPDPFDIRVVAEQILNIHHIVKNVLS